MRLRLTRMAAQRTIDHGPRSLERFSLLLHTSALGCGRCDHRPVSLSGAGRALGLEARGARIVPCASSSSLRSASVDRNRRRSSSTGISTHFPCCEKLRAPVRQRRRVAFTVSWSSQAASASRSVFRSKVDTTSCTACVQAACRFSPGLPAVPSHRQAGNGLFYNGQGRA